MKNLLLLVCCLVSSTAFSQFVLLKDIAENTNSGLGGNLRGLTHSVDGLCYFLGAEEDFNFTLFRTDGTIDGTEELFPGSFSNIISIKEFNENLIILDYHYDNTDFFDHAEIHVVDVTNNDIETINYFSDKDLGKQFIDIGDKLLLVEDSDEVFVTNGLSSGSSLIGTLEGESGDVRVSQNDSLVIISDSDFPRNFFPQIINKTSLEMVSLLDYLSSVQDFGQINEAYLLDNLLYLFTFDGTFNRTYYYNFTDNSLFTTNFQDFEGDFQTENNTTIVFEENDLKIIDAVTGGETTVGRIFGDIDRIIEHEGKFYFYGKANDTTGIVVTDWTTEGTSVIPNSAGSSGYFSTNPVFFEEKLWTFRSEGDIQQLVNYDLETFAVDTVGLIADITSSLIARRGMFKALDKLLVSRYLENSVGHELYVYDLLNSNIEFNNELNISLKATVVDSHIELVGDKSIVQVVLYDGQGIEIMRNPNFNLKDILNVNHLNSGMYFLTVNMDNNYKTLKFYKK